MDENYTHEWDQKSLCDRVPGAVKPRPRDARRKPRNNFDTTPFPDCILFVIDNPINRNEFLLCSFLWTPGHPVTYA